MPDVTKISAETVRADFNDPVAVVHYARAAHFLGLWKSERILIERFFPDKEAHLLEAGCGAGRVMIGLWDQGYRQLTAFDFAGELVDQARGLAAERGATSVRIEHDDATTLEKIRRAPLLPGEALAGQPPTGRPEQGNPPRFDGVLFMFNGLMQIPGRENRRQALRQLRGVARAGAPILFTTHDRDSSALERAMWRLETEHWVRGTQDPRLLEFGDRYFEDEAGRTFMHLPVRTEIIEDLATTGWKHEFDAMRSEIARESRAVVDFSDACRFWVARA